MWYAGEPNATKSPGLALANDGTRVPTRACLLAVLGSDRPFRLKACWTNPEQSRPLPGVFPPHLYGVPRHCMAVATTWDPVRVGVAAWATPTVQPSRAEVSTTADTHLNRRDLFVSR